jgi:hypothetical protein
VLQFDDLIVLLRNAFLENGRFGCSIDPKRENLASTRQFLSQQRPLRRGERPRWLEQLRGAMGNQDVRVYGIDPRTRVGRVIVEADYHMKLIGMGLEPGVLGVTSYLNLIEVAPGGAPPELDVLRWWFTVDYDALVTNEQKNAFAFAGQGVKVLSENELLTQQGQRVATGDSEALNREFAASFTEHFPELADKYPVYAELKNVFDLALLAALIRQEDLLEHVGWHASHFLDPGRCRVELGRSPEEVPTVVSHRVIDRRHVVAGVSGGVSVDTTAVVTPTALRVDTYGRLNRDRQVGTPQPSDGRWWWD